jgi:hypothetical protein
MSPVSSASRGQDAVERGATSNRVLCGGSWNGNSGNVRSSYRNINTPDYAFGSVGFRVARAPLRFPLLSSLFLLLLPSPRAASRYRCRVHPRTCPG